VGSPNDMDVESVGTSGGACFGRGRRESGVSCGAVTLKQRRTELIRGYLAPRSQRGDGREKRPKDRVKTGRKALRKTLISLKIPKRHNH